MILRRFGTSYQSVDMDFDAKALSEIAFRRNREHSLPVDEFESAYETIETVELSEEAEGAVQTETLQQMLDQLRDRVEEMRAGLADGQVLVVDNDKGHDYPKPRQITKNVIVEGENRLCFEYTMSPALRVSIRQRSG